LTDKPLGRHTRFVMNENTPSSQRANIEAVRERIWARWKAIELQLLLEQRKERANG